MKQVIAFFANIGQSGFYRKRGRALEYLTGCLAEMEMLLLREHRVEK